MKFTTIFLAFIGILFAVVGFSFLLSWPVMALWNGCLVPAVDGVHNITWLQAWGLSILCAFLFKPSGLTTKKE